MSKLKTIHYGWFMVIIGAFILSTFSLVIYTFGVFLRPLTLEFNWDRGALSVAFALHLLLAGVLGIFAGKLSDKYGPRPLSTICGLFGGTGFILMSQVTSLWQAYVVWGICMGISGACSVVPIMSTIPKWFAKRRGIAVGLTGTGFALGGIVAAPLTQWLISVYGWQQAFIILGLIMIIVIVPLAQLLKHSPKHIGLREYGDEEPIEDKQALGSAAKGLSLTKAVRTSRFWLYGAIHFCFLFILQVIFTHIVSYTIDIRISGMIAATLVSAIAASNLVSRNFIGIICERFGVRPVLTSCLIIITLALICLLLASEIWMFYLFAAIFGIAFGGMALIQILMLAEFFGFGYLGVIYGSFMLLGTIGGALGGPMAGAIFDTSGSYTWAFIICLALAIIAFILSLFLLKAKSWCNEA